jgi:hypothetical protein
MQNKQQPQQLSKEFIAKVKANKDKMIERNKIINK